MRVRFNLSYVVKSKGSLKYQMKKFSGLRINRDQNISLLFSGWRTICYPVTSLLAGLFAAQVISTLQVYLSNKALYRTLVVVNEAGYLALPNQHILARLQAFGPAFYGGLFFTLSVGAGISLLSFAAAWVWDRLFSRHIIPLIFLLFIWAGSFVAVNWEGGSPLVTAYFLVIPIAVFYVALRWMPPRTGRRPWHQGMAHLIPVALLACLWVPQMENSLFLNLRDHLLLSNSLGSKITDFYYKYTLYPAEVFKPLDQKILKTCSLDPVKKKSLKKLLEGKLLGHDYLNTGGEGELDLKIRESGRDLILENSGRAILKTTANDFLSNPANILKQFSSETDKYALFRQFTFLSILIGLPVTLYLFFYTFLLSLLCLVFDRRISSVTASILCLLAGMLLLMPIYLGNGEKADQKDLALVLASGRWQERVAALKIIRKERLDVSDFAPYNRMLSSPYIPERYWLTKALGVSRSHETYKDLLGLLNDPSPVVVSMAFFALGQRGDERAVTEILKRIKTSDHWYTQWYAYKALKALGWKQTESR